MKRYGMSLFTTKSFHKRLLHSYDLCDLAVGRWRMTESFNSSLGIFVLLDGAPFIYCGMQDCELSGRQANALAQSEQLLAVATNFELGSKLSVGVVTGKSFDTIHFQGVLLKEERGGAVDGQMIKFFHVVHPGRTLIARMLCLDDKIGPLLHPGSWTKTGFDIVREWPEIQENYAWELKAGDEMRRSMALAKQNNDDKMP